jgi:hypothetical protein
MLGRATCAASPNRLEDSGKHIDDIVFISTICQKFWARCILVNPIDDRTIDDGSNPLVGHH